MIYGYKLYDNRINAVTFDDLPINTKIHLLCSRGKNKCKSIKNTRSLIDKFIAENCFNYLYFVTFTFNKEFTTDNYNLWNRKEFTNYLRRDKFSKLCNFILYCDFGSLNDRFHLHGVCSCSFELDLKNRDYFNKFGFTKLIKLNNSNSDYIVKYSVKFNEHVYFRLLKVNNFKL